MTALQKDVTTLLRLATSGDQQAKSELFERVKRELWNRAKAMLRREGSLSNLQTTILVDDAFLRLVGDPSMNWENRGQFYCCAARVMREMLVDDARRRRAVKRGGGRRPAHLDANAEPVERRGVDPFTVLAIHEVLNKLNATHADLIQIVELHFFGGWELKEIADKILHVPYGAVKRKWRMAKALLHREINGDEP